MTAHAEWESNGLTEKYFSYIDSSRIKIEGRYKSIWELQDFISPDIFAGKQSKSAVVKSLIDCQSSRSNIVDFYFYSEQMGGGEIIHSSHDQLGWKSPPPNSIGDSLINIACGRK